MDIDARAKADGELGLPPSESEGLTRVEDEIASELDSLRRQSLRVLQENLDAYSSLLSECRVEGAEVSRAIVEGGRAIDRMQVEIHSAELELRQLKNEMGGLEREFSEFRSQHHLLERLPHYPKSAAVSYLVLVLLLVFETFLNGNFFARGSEQGMIGGVLAASVFSFLNLALGVCAGRFAWRGTNLVSPMKYLAWLGIALWLVGTFYLNLFVAHYRDLFAANGGVVTSASLFARIGEGVSGLDETESIVLLLLGCLFNLAAAVDGFRMDDRYPYYGAVDRRRRRAAERYLDFFQDQLSQLEGHRSSAIDEISNELASVSERARVRARAEVGRVALLQSFAGHLGDVDRVHAELVRRYWDGNSRSRSSPAPQRFHQAPLRLPEVPLVMPSPSLPENDLAVEHLRTALEELLGRFQDLLKGIVPPPPPKTDAARASGGPDEA